MTYYKYYYHLKNRGTSIKKCDNFGMFTLYMVQAPFYLLRLFGDIAPSKTH